MQRGIDPRRYALLAFGGAGPLHAARSRTSSGSQIVCPRASGVLAALGLVVSRAGETPSAACSSAATARPLRRSPSSSRNSAGRRARALGEARPSCSASTSCATGARRSSSRSPARCRRTGRPAERLRGATRGTLRLPRSRAGAATGDDPGQRDRSRSRLALAPPTRRRGRAGRRRATLGRDARARRAAGRDRRGTGRGPAVVELPEATLLVAPGWSGPVDPTGSIRLDPSAMIDPSTSR